LKSLCSNGQSPVAYGFVVANWFDRHRGLALGIAMSGVGLGTSIIPPVAAYLIGAFGWRWAYLGLGSVILVLAFFPVFFFIHDPRENEGARRTVGDHELPGVSVREALGGWRFWGLLVAFLLGVIALNGTLTQIVAILMDRGQPLQAATSVLAASGIAALAGRILSGWCVDRFFAPYVAVAFYILPMIGTVLLGSALGQPAPLLGALFCGAALGGEIDLMAFLISRYFGLKSYGKLFGTIFGFFAGATGVGPFLSGLSFDVYHSYTPAFALYEVLLVIAALIFLPLGPYPFPAQPHPRLSDRAAKAPA
jgi:predicted MFS family arabinose efflux permease